MNRYLSRTIEYGNTWFGKVRTLKIHIYQSIVLANRVPKVIGRCWKSNMCSFVILGRLKSINDDSQSCRKGHKILFGISICPIFWKSFIIYYHVTWYHIESNDFTRYDIVWYGLIWYYMIHCDTTWYTWYGTMWYVVITYDMIA